MAKANLTKLLNEVLDKIGRTGTYNGKQKRGAEIYREHNSDLETHTMTIDAKHIIAQVTDEMYYREGLGKHSRGQARDALGQYASGIGEGTGGAKTSRGESVLREGSRKKGAKDALDKVIRDKVPGLCQFFYDFITKLERKTAGPYQITYLPLPNKPTNFSFSVAQRKKGGKGGKVFGYIKGSIKQDAQYDLIQALNKWAKEYSQRDESKEMGRTGGGKEDKYKGREDSADGLTRYEVNPNTGKTIKVRMVRKGFGPGESVSDLGHEPGSSISEKQQQEAKGVIEAKQGELYNLDDVDNAAMKYFMDALKGNIKWTIKDYDKIGSLEKTTRIGFEAPYLNSNVAKKGEDIALEATLHRLIAEIGGKQKKDGTYWLLSEGSDSMFQKIDKIHKNILVEEIKGSKNIKRVNLEHKKIKYSKSTVSKKINAKRTIGTIAAIKTNDKTKTRASFKKKGKNVRKQATAAAMPLELLGIINKDLPDMVRANMGAPALTNQTGVFASSVRATDMHMTPQGFPSIGYTYQRDPYEVHEQEYEYDPRRLIDRSMREIAAQYAIGRFYTRRV